MTKVDCEIIKDLLPLYADGVCSDLSKTIVEDHLEECEKCKIAYDSIKNDEIKEIILPEAVKIIENREKKTRRKTLTVGLVFACIFMVPVLTCLIVNLCIGAPLGWFFIVLTALMTGASLVVVPLLVPEYKFISTMGAFCASLMLLFLSCNMYGGGRWFFVASTATMFGLSVVLMPGIVNAAPLNRALRHHKTLTVFAVDTTWYALMIISDAYFKNSMHTVKNAFAVSMPFFALAWFIMLICSYLPVNPLVKGGICTAVTGIFTFFCDKIINMLLGNKVAIGSFRPFSWNDSTMSENILYVFMFVCVFIGVALLLGGICMGVKRRK